MISIVTMYLIMIRFVKIKGWDMNEMLFLYSFLFISYSLFVFVFAGIRDFDEMVQMGELDRFLLRPLGLMYQVIASRADIAATLGHGAVGVILLVKTAGSVGLEWNLRNTLAYHGVLGGTQFVASFSWYLHVSVLGNQHDEYAGDFSMPGGLLHIPLVLSGANTKFIDIPSAVCFC